MKRIRVGAVVEGDGEIETIGILLRRMGDELYSGQVVFDVPRPVRRKRHKLVRRQGGALHLDDDEIRNAVELAAKNIANDGAILFLIDSDRDPACTIGPAILQRNLSTHGHLLHSVVLPVTEFEAWYVAAAASLAGYNGLPASLSEPPDPESLGSPKAWMARHMGRPYSPTVDQPKFASRFDMAHARRAGSFDKLCRDIQAIVDATPCTKHGNCAAISDEPLP